MSQTQGHVITMLQQEQLFSGRSWNAYFNTNQHTQEQFHNVKSSRIEETIARRNSFSTEHSSANSGELWISALLKTKKKKTRLGIRRNIKS